MNITGKMTVQEAAKRMGVTPRYIHMGLQSGRLPFGTAVKMEGRWSYYINRTRFEKWMTGEDMGRAREVSAECEVTSTKGVRP